MGVLHEFNWASSVPNSVIVTGTFDDWQSTLHLHKDEAGHFAGKVDLPYGHKVLFKYIVDGNWTHNPREPCESDASGFVNNVLLVPTEEEVKAKEEADAKAKAEEEAKAKAAAQPVPSAVPATSEEPLAQAKEAASEIGHEISVAAGAVAVSAGAFFSSAIASVKSVIDPAPEPEARSEALSSSSSSPLDSSVVVPNERPVDPAPTPAAGVQTSTSPATAVRSFDSAFGAVPAHPPAPLLLNPETSTSETISSGEKRVPEVPTAGIVPVVPNPPATETLDHDRESMPAPISYPTGVSYSPVSSKSTPTAAVSASKPKSAAPVDDVFTAKEEVKEIQADKPKEEVAHKASVVSEIKSEVPTAAAVSTAALASAAAATTATKTGAADVASSDLAGKADVAEIKEEHTPTDVAHKKDVLQDVQAHVPTVPATTATTASETTSAPVASSTAPAPAIAVTSATPGATPSAASKTDKKSKPLANGTTDSTKESKKDKVVADVKAKAEDVKAKATDAVDGKKSSSKASGKKFTKADNDGAGINSKEPKSKRYSTLGKKDGAAPSAAPVTPKKQIAATTGANGTPASATASPTTGNKSDYTTAPSTPATPAQRERKSSFFQRVKSALSPNHKK